MRHACLQVGQQLTYDNEFYEIQRIHESGIYQLESQKDFRLINRSRVELLIDFEKGKIKFAKATDRHTLLKPENTEAKDLSCFSEEHQRQAKLRFDYIRAASDCLGEIPKTQGLDKVILRTAHILNDNSPPSASSLYRWWKKWRETGCDITALVSKDRRSGYVTQRFSRPIQKILNEIIQDEFLVREKFTVQDVCDSLASRINQYNRSTTRTLKVPSRASVYRYVSKIDKYDYLVAKKGKRHANSVLRATGKGVNPNYILGWVEMDHTPLDLIVIDDKTFLPIGRPTLTVLIDKNSRVFLGYSLSFEPPSELSMIRALRHAIFPKLNIKTQYPHIENEWNSYGIPITLVVDNGLEFHSKLLRQLCYELNIELIFCPKQEPQFKGCVERTLGTLNRDVSHRCAGTTFSNISERGTYKSADLARVTLAEANELIAQWIVDNYHQRKHSTTQYTPDYLWKEGLQSVEPRLPESIDAFDLACSRPYDNRKLSHDGIQFLYLNYNSADMQIIRRNPMFSGNVNIRVNHENLAFIWVHDEQNGEYIKVNCTNKEYANGLTLLQHKKLLEDNKIKSKECYDEAKYLLAKEKLLHKIKDLNSERLLRERKKKARLNSRIEKLNRTELEATQAEPIIFDEYDVNDVPEFEFDQIGDL